MRCGAPSHVITLGPPEEFRRCFERARGLSERAVQDVRESISGERGASTCVWLRSVLASRALVHGIDALMPTEGFRRFGALLSGPYGTGWEYGPRGYLRVGDARCSCNLPHLRGGRATSGSRGILDCRRTPRKLAAAGIPLGGHPVRRFLAGGIGWRLELTTESRCV